MLTRHLITADLIFYSIRLTDDGAPALLDPFFQTSPLRDESPEEKQGPTA
jgi:hypothetical protein